MKTARGIALLVGIICGITAWPHSATAQACKDEASMVSESQKALADVLATVKKEALPDFERAYH